MAEVVIVPSPAEGGELGAAVIAALVARKPDAVLGLATGSTPLPVYLALARRVGEGLDMTKVRGFALDEYVGIAPGHPESYRSVIAREAVEPLKLDPQRINVPAGDPEGIEHAGERYEQLIRASGGIDLQILGIGSDGHVGFNEPGSSFASLTRVKTLTEQTRRDNARFFDSVEDVPLHCITQGIGTILRAAHLVLFAFGDEKAEALAASIEGPLSSSHPGSAVQLHPHATIIVDEGAAARLEHADYYRYAWAHKPAWQEL